MRDITWKERQKKEHEECKSEGEEIRTQASREEEE